jgi:hypothetical protein
MYTGSMIGAGADVFAVWGYVIAHLHRASATVELNPAYLAAVIGSTKEAMQRAVERLCAPDQESRSPLEEGRRLVREGQFLYRVVNAKKYAGMRDEDDRRVYQAEWARTKRVDRRRPVSTTVDPPSTTVDQASTDIDQHRPRSTYAEAEADVDGEAEADPDLITETKIAAAANCKPRAKAAPAPPDSDDGGDGTKRILAKTILDCPRFADLDANHIAQRGLTVMIAHGWPLAAVTKAIHDCNAKTPPGMTAEARQAKLIGFIDHAGSKRVGQHGPTIAEELERKRRDKERERRDDEAFRKRQAEILAMQEERRAKAGNRSA